MQRVKMLTATVVATLIATGSVLAASRVQKNYDQLAEFTGTIQTSACNALPGPQLSVSGQITLAGLKYDVIFKHPGGPDPIEPVVVEQVVVPQGHSVTIPGQSVVGSLADNPYMWLQLFDQTGRALTSEIFLGRCDQAQFSPSANFIAPAVVSADVTATACNSPSPALSLDGTADLSGINAKVIFRTTNLPHPRGQVDQSAIEMVLLPPGVAFEIPQQAVIGGAGSNPLISIQLRQGNGEEIGKQISLGRCEALSN